MSSPSSQIAILEDVADSADPLAPTPAQAPTQPAAKADGRAAAFAQQDDAARAWLQADPDRRQPRLLLVQEGCALADSLVRGPTRRDQVIDRPPKFIADDLRFAGGPTTESAIRRVKQIASLERLMARRTLEHIANLENRLQVDDTLTAADRSQLRRQLSRIQAPGQPMWENWVRLQPPRLHHVFDRMVNDWLAAPVDPAEEHLFVPGWRQAQSVWKWTWLTQLEETNTMTENMLQPARTGGAEDDDDVDRSLRTDIERLRQIIAALTKDVNAVATHNDLLKKLGEMLHVPDDRGRDRAHDAFAKAIAPAAILQQSTILAGALANIRKLEREFLQLESQVPQKTRLNEMLSALHAEVCAAGLANVCLICGRTSDGTSPRVSEQEIDRRLHEARLARSTKETRRNDSLRQSSLEVSPAGQHDTRRRPPTDIERVRQLTELLVKDVSAVTSHDDLFEQLAEVLHAPGDSGRDKACNAYRKVILLPEHIEQARKLTCALAQLLALQRASVEQDARGASIDTMLIKIDAEQRAAKLENRCSRCGLPLDGIGHP